MLLDSDSDFEAGGFRGFSDIRFEGVQVVYGLGVFGAHAIFSFLIEGNNCVAGVVGRIDFDFKR